MIFHKLNLTKCLVGILIWLGIFTSYRSVALQELSITEVFQNGFETKSYGALRKSPHLITEINTVVLSDTSLSSGFSSSSSVSSASNRNTIRYEISEKGVVISKIEVGSSSHFGNHTNLSSASVSIRLNPESILLSSSLQVEKPVSVSLYFESIDISVFRHGDSIQIAPETPLLFASGTAEVKLKSKTHVDDKIIEGYPLVVSGFLIDMTDLDIIQEKVMANEGISLDVPFEIIFWINNSSRIFKIESTYHDNGTHKYFGLIESKYPVYPNKIGNPYFPEMIEYSFSDKVGEFEIPNWGWVKWVSGHNFSDNIFYDFQRNRWLFCSVSYWHFGFSTEEGLWFYDLSKGKWIWTRSDIHPWVWMDSHWILED